MTVQNALERTCMSRRLEVLAGQVERRWELIGDSAPMRRLKSELRRAAASDSRILLQGENGSGKELAARLAHRLSSRARQPFVEVNCAAIPEELIESELFGHVRGSFTGASSDRAGRFEQANLGTLFLDEIADMSLKTQAKVLRALQEQRFERVGSATPIQVDVRVIAATNKNLDEEIRAGRFREDLYFRLAVIPIRIPPLRERREDVPELIEYFLAHYARELGRRPKRLEPDAMARLQGARLAGQRARAAQPGRAAGDHGAGRRDRRPRPARAAARRPRRPPGRPLRASISPACATPAPPSRRSSSRRRSPTPKATCRGRPSCSASSAATSTASCGPTGSRSSGSRRVVHRRRRL